MSECDAAFIAVGNFNNTVQKLRDTAGQFQTLTNQNEKHSLPWFVLHRSRWQLRHCVPSCRRRHRRRSRKVSLPQRAGLSAGDPLLSRRTQNCPGRAGDLLQPRPCRIKIPGRELRAICWFEAYLAATPKHPTQRQ